MYGVFYKVLPYSIRISLRFVETVFCKVFYRLFSVIPHFFQRCPLLISGKKLGLLLISPI